ncbi:unnamed protein product [Trichogramma brassicae]|uniref:C2H2-type domain-containing protein n=1 Tax=Trichogramma brassicae TaxID=86971 RepID=A0A6H5J337_9HYME|nr:unnamed protein product [Trichogramma brassicae]
MNENEKISEEVTSENNSNEHHTVVSNEKKYVCNICQEAFTLESSMITHRNTIHKLQKDYACDKCEEKFEFRSHLSRHQISLHRGCKDFSCDQCAKKFVKKSSLTTHQKLVHKDKDGIDFSCHKCERKFENKSTLLKHKKIFHEVFKDYLCEKCAKRFGNKHSLLLHIKTVHDKCEKKFGQKSQLLFHQRIIHDAQKNHACDKYEKKFVRKSYLLPHMSEVHESRKDFACDKCERKYGSKSGVFKHQEIVHEGHKDYGCDRCEKKFGYKSALISHQKTVHEGRKDYLCEKCEKMFGDSSALIRHQKTVHEGRKDYSCDIKKCPDALGVPSNSEFIIREEQQQQQQQQQHMRINHGRVRESQYIERTRRTATQRLAESSRCAAESFGLHFALQKPRDREREPCAAQLCISISLSLHALFRQQQQQPTHILYPLSAASSAIYIECRCRAFFLRRKIDSGTLLIEDKDSKTDDYPAKDNLPQNRNNSGMVLIEDVESESDSQPSSDDLLQRQPLTIEELDSDGNIATNDPSENQPTIEENSSSDVDRDVSLAWLRQELINWNNSRLNNLLVNNESEIENDSETELHQLRGPVETERHFYECTLRSITNKIREAVVVAVTHDPDRARTAAFKDECERALAVYENARQQPLVRSTESSTRRAPRSFSSASSYDRLVFRTMAQENQDCLNELKRMRENVNWEMEDERREFYRQVYPIICNWQGQLPNLRDIFRTDEIEWLLAESVKTYGMNPEPFVDFVINTGYKDEDGKHLLRRTTPIHRSARRWFPGRDIVVRKLFRIYDKFDVNYVDEDGYTHFHIACKCGCVDAVKKFLDLGQGPNLLEEKTGESPLHLALANHRKDVAKLLLRNGANLILANKNGSTPLHLISKIDDDEGLMEMFFEICRNSQQTVQVDARDNEGNTPLNLLLMYKMQLASSVLRVVEHLKDKGYELDRSDFLTIATSFSEYGLFEKWVDLDESWYDDVRFTEKAKSIMIIKPDWSLYDLTRLRPVETKKLLAKKEYIKFACSKKLNKLLTRHRRPCALHLCEKISRGFFQRWALDAFLELTNYQLPILCCEMIIKHLKNEDLCHICRSHEDSEKQSEMECENEKPAKGRKAQKKL